MFAASVTMISLNITWNWQT